MPSWIERVFRHRDDVPENVVVVAVDLDASSGPKNIDSGAWDDVRSGIDGVRYGRDVLGVTTDDVPVTFKRVHPRKGAFFGRRDALRVTIDVVQCMPETLFVHTYSN